METPCVELKPHLPNLPQGVEATSASHVIPPDIPMRSSPLDLIHRLLVYPSGDRLTAADVLNHSWFRDEEALLLPTEIPPDVSGPPVMSVWNGQPLGYWVEAIFGSGRDA